MRSPRRLAIVATLSAAALLLSGCVSLPLDWLARRGSTPTPAHTAEDHGADLARFYEQRVDWTSCGSGLDCTSVTVPVDWEDPSGETLTVAVTRHRATGSRVGAILYNPGGPGASGFDYVHDYAEYIATPAVLQHYDLIGFDPRGVKRSTGIACQSGADKDEMLYGTYQAAYGTQEWVDEFTSRAQEWIAACQDHAGELLGHLDGASVARDMDVIRAVLGEDRMNYLGYSYGTYLGANYAELFPERVGRMVLDGAVDPTVSDANWLITQMGGFESAFRAYLADCLASTGCPFSGNLDQALGQVRDLLAGIDARRLRSSDGRVLDVATVGTAIAENLYTESYWSYMTEMFADLQDGDAESTFESADEYNDYYGPGSYDGNGFEVYTSVQCDESQVGRDGVDVLEGLARISAAAPTVGAAIAYDDYAVLNVLCANWPYPIAERPAVFDAAGSAPIVVIGTTNDPATPYAQAQSLAEQLENGVLVTYHGEGHTVYGNGVACIDDAIDAYLVDGDVPSAGLEC